MSSETQTLIRSLVAARALSSPPCKLTTGLTPPSISVGVWNSSQPGPNMTSSLTRQSSIPSTPSSLWCVYFSFLYKAYNQNTFQSAFISGVQSQIISFTLPLEQTTLSRAANTFGFLGLVLDVVGTLTLFLSECVAHSKKRSVRCAGGL